MRLKEIQRTAHQAWSPAGHHPMYLALGTAAQQLDASFNTTAALEIFEMDFSQPSLDMQLKGSLRTPNRLHSIVWVNFGMGADGSGGRLIGGSENGILTVYNPDIIMSSGADAVVGQSDKHTGPIRALDFNPFQSNLLASGANDSEIYIWDLNNFSSPMTPGAKTQPVEDISVVSWNRQVQHILASANPSGKAVVWDLRKNEPIIKISDHSNRMHCSGMLWHPDVATQLVLASEDDRLPVIQMWDLRFATSPLKVLENHTRGILSISWSQADSELLLSSAKDNRILCWNPNTGEVITVPKYLPLLRLCNLSEQISSSFDTMDPFGTGQVLPPLQVPHPTVQDTIVPPLKKPPKWMRRPVGASFGFGGKLISFENPKVPPMQSPQPIPRQVFLSQVTTETEFLQRSKELQAALQSGSFNSYCQTKIQNARSDAEQDIWKFLLVGQKYLLKQKNSISMLISSVVTQNWRDIVQSCDLDNWKEALAALLTYAHPEDFACLCDILGGRLENEKTEKCCLQACLCYICSGNIERLVECWTSHRDSSSPLGLEDNMPKGFMVHLIFLCLMSQIPDNYTPPAPITAPVMGFPVEAPQPHDHAQVPPGAPQEPSMQLLQQLPTERVEQKEIPAEHMILKTTFDSLVQRCQLAARDPQTKRKLDDSAKRLGHLYDKLREQSLSQNILNGLHEISCCVASQNYQRGLEVHTQVVSSSNFSEISAFMPILKVVMTIANKLGV
eukprot:XP_011600778.1 PREDICTED: protein transport protein Sec31B [Takifugu rubripes]